MTRITPEQKIAFCKMVQTNQEVFDTILEDMQMSLFREFVTATDDKRKIIGDIINASQLFQAEMSKIIASNIDDDNINS